MRVKGIRQEANFAGQPKVERMINTLIKEASTQVLLKVLHMEDA